MRSFLKRLFDLFISSACVVLLLPIFLIIGILIKIDSPGPIFFKHDRVGKNFINIKMWKFRTMVVNANLIGPGLTQDNDNRITKFGRFLRRTSLDELPQLINIIKGEMSLVGPRPEIPIIVRTYSEEQKLILTVKPGLTGLSQINGRDDLPMKEKLNYELEYISKNSMLFDLQIILKTIPALISGRGNRY